MTDKALQEHRVIANVEHVTALKRFTDEEKQRVIEIALASEKVQRALELFANLNRTAESI